MPPTKPKTGDPRAGSRPSAPARALASADPQSTASISAAFQALAYAPASSSPVDRSKNRRRHPRRSPAAPRAAQSGGRPSQSTRSSPRDRRGQGSVVATSARIAAATAQRCLDARHDPGAEERERVDVHDGAGRHRHDPDAGRISSSRRPSVTMSFSEDPQMGLVSDQFTGSAIATLATQSFRDADRIAALIVSSGHETASTIPVSSSRTRGPIRRVPSFGARRQTPSAICRGAAGYGSRLALRLGRDDEGLDYRANAPHKHPQRLHVGFRESFPPRRVRWRPACVSERSCAAP